MKYPTLRKSIITIIITALGVLALAGTHLAFSGELLKEQALLYRQKGYQAQKSGMLAEALGFYQKAIQIDSGSSLLYNDIGVVYELLGDSNFAQEAYLKALSIDPNYSKAYYNLAQLYETRGDLYKAAEYWLKIMNLNNEDEAIVKKAQDRIYEIGKVMPEIRKKYLDSEVSLLEIDVSSFKKILATDNKVLAQFYIDKAGRLVEGRNYIEALKLYLDARQLDPQNSQVDTLIETTQKKVLL